MYAARQITKKAKTSTVLFKFTEDEHNRINWPFRHCLQILKDGNGTQTDWYNVLFRIGTALNIAKKLYADVTISEIQHIYDLCEAVELRARETQHKVWAITEEEYGWFVAAFETVEELQRVVPRKTFHECGVISNKTIHDKYVKGIDQRVDKK